MRNHTPKYHKPIKNIGDPIVQVDSWHDAITAFDEKNYDKALRSLLHYINQDVANKIPPSGDFSFEHPQGSSRITFGVRDGVFFIKSPFVKITDESNKIAALRHANELNFSFLTITQVHLINQTLWFKFETPLHLCQPNKIYDALREICVASDVFDDEFIEKYGVERIQEPVIQALSEQEKEYAWEQIQSILSEYRRYMDYFEEKRWEGSQWDIIMLSLLQLGNMPYIQGIFRTDLHEYIQNVNNSRIDFHFRIDKGKNFFKQLAEKSRDEIMKDVYYIQNLMGLKWRSSAKFLQEEAREYEEQVRKYRSSNDNFNIAYYLSYMFLYISYYYNLDQDYRDFITRTLEKASGETYENATKIYLESYEHLLNETLPKEFGVNKQKKGFLGRLFEVATNLKKYNNGTI